VNDLLRSKAAAKQKALDGVAKEIISKATLVESAGNRKVAAFRQDDLDMDDLLGLADRLRDGGISVAILGTAKGNRCALVVMVEDGTAEAGVDAASIVRKGAALVGGSGGGKRRLAQAGGKDPSRLEEALSAAKEESAAQLAKVYG